MSTHSSEAVALKKEIGILRGVSIIISIIVGSGIFVSPIGVLRYTRSVGMSFIMWMVSGIFSMLGAIVYAELGVTIPKSGGEYSYVLECFGPVLAFMVFWNTVIIIGAVSAAANSLVFADYLLKPFFPDCECPQIPAYCISLLALMTLAFINAYSVKMATRIAVLFTVAKIGALLIIIGIGLYSLYYDTTSFESPFAGSDYSPGAMALSFYQGFWAFGGWNYLNFLTEEMKNPAKNLPICIVIAMLIIITVYLLANVAYLGVLSPFEMLNTDSVAVAVLFAVKKMGVMAWIIPVFVSLSVFGSINGEFLSLSRLIAVGAEDGSLPQVFGFIDFKRVTPLPGVGLLFILSFGFIFYKGIDFLIELSGFAFVLVSSMAVASLLYHRYKYPAFNAGFKLPIIFPIAFLMVDIFIGIMTIYQQPYESMMNLALMFFGLVFYFLWINRPMYVKKKMIVLTRNCQLLLHLLPQDQEKPAEEKPGKKEIEPQVIAN